MSVDRLTVLSAIIDQGVIPVFYHPDLEVCKNVIQACANGGAKCVEFTNRGDFAWQVFMEVTQYFRKADPSVIMGVGSIVSPEIAGLYIANGANFVVGPTLNPDVAKLCNRHCLPYSPGCGSATEIMQAQELGCEIVKVFPGSQVGGPEFVSAVRWPHALDQADADRWRRPDRGIAGQVVQGRHRGLRHRLKDDHQGPCLKPRIMPASRKRSPKRSRSPRRCAANRSTRFLNSRRHQGAAHGPRFFVRVYLSGSPCETPCASIIPRYRAGACAWESSSHHAQSVAL